MKTQMLGRKQNMKPTDQDIWWNVVRNINKYVSRDDVEVATEIARKRIASIAKGRRVAYSWSGGKDSLVLADICKSVGIMKCQCILTNVEYPAWEAFLKLNAPPGCEMVQTGIGLQYLRDNEDMIFPRGKKRQKWHKIVQQNNFIDYLKRGKLDVVILGHRTIDGNVCGKDGIRKRPDGGILYSPLFDWSHELIFAYLFYHGIELPFIYRWKNGFRQGTQFWPSRNVPNVMQGYREVYEIDASIVEKAAEVLPSAKKFLEELQKWTK